MSISHGIGTAPILTAPLGLSSLFLFGYLGFKIYEFFVPQKETSTQMRGTQNFKRSHF